MPDPQKVLALAIVLAVVIMASWRYWRRRARSGSRRAGESGPDKPTKEVPLRFYRRKP